MTTTATALHPSVAPRVTPDELFARAETLVPRLRERADECERLGRVPDATIQDYSDAGLLRVMQPARYGGHELGLDVVWQLDRILARGCPSQAWVHNIISDHTQQLGLFNVRAQDDVWRDNPLARVCGSVEPVGRGRIVDGGVMFSGRHGYGSGIDHVQWVVCGGHTYDGDRQIARAFFLVPTSEIEILDDWHVVGLGGTGSKTFLVRDTFVPQHRILLAPVDDSDLPPVMPSTATAAHFLPRVYAMPNSFAGIAVGTAEGFLDQWLTYTAARRSHGVHSASLTGTQITAGEAAAAIEAARRLSFGAVSDMMRTVERGERPSREQKLQTRLAAAWACRTALEAVQKLFQSAGARALFEDNPMQKRLRDLYAATAHFSVTFDNAMSEWGAAALNARV